MSAQPGVSPSVERYRGVVNRVLASRDFHKAGRLRALLTYISERSFAEPDVPIREVEIAEKVFGRTPDQSSDDTIVRVHASQLRKRLEQYFAEEGRDESIVIEIPKGNYSPVFRHREPNPTVEIEQVAQVLKEPRIRPAWVVIVSAMVVAVGLLVWDDLRVRGQLFSSPDAEQRLFWSPFLNSELPTDIVVADSSLSVFQDLTKLQVGVQSYANRDYVKRLETLSLPPAVGDAARMLAGRRHTSIADANIARRISLLAGHHNDRLQIIHSRDFQVRLLRTNNVILLGSSRSNPWEDLVGDRLNFWYSYDSSGTASIRNKNPKPGEKALYTCEDNPRQGLPSGYCVVARIPNLADSGKVLIIAGTEMEGTEAGGEFVLTGHTLRQLREAMGVRSGSPFPDFEALVSTTHLAGASPRAEVVAFRVH
jgi:hypothetical protein